MYINNAVFDQDMYFICRDKPAQKKSHQPAAAAQAVRGRSDSIHSNDSLDLGLRSERSSMHERTTPTKGHPAKPFSFKASENATASNSDSSVGLSLPELKLAAHEHSKLVLLRTHVL